MSSSCVDCGAPARGVRCQACYVKLEQATAVEVTEQDREVLGLLERGVRQSEIARQLGVSRQRVSQLVKRAYGRR